MVNWWFVLATAFVSCWLTGLVRRYALANSVLDVPNGRSSHSVPTPRGGGVAIVLSTVVVLFAGVLAEATPLSLALAVGASGGGVAILGFMDDHQHVAARWRLVAHFLAAASGLMFCGGLAPLRFGPFVIEYNFVLAVLGVLYLVWMLNLYNFMDGIDGIAAVEASTACLGMVLLYWVSDNPEMILAPLVVAGAALGFLVWNFPHAKIFMGDAGSGFLGLVLGLLSVHASWVHPSYFWAWCILLGVFVVDATFTLLRRILGGAKVYEAHRSHAYQHAARAAGSHLPVTFAVWLINVCWLLPIAAAVVTLGLDGFVGVLIAYVPLLIIAICYKAGADEG